MPLHSLVTVEALGCSVPAHLASFLPAEEDHVLQLVRAHGLKRIEWEVTAIKLMYGRRCSPAPCCYKAAPKALGRKLYESGWKEVNGRVWATYMDVVMGKGADGWDWNPRWTERKIWTGKGGWDSKQHCMWQTLCDFSSSTYSTSYGELSGSSSLIHPLPRTNSCPNLHLACQPLSLHSATLSGRRRRGSQHLVRHLPL